MKKKSPRGIPDFSRHPATPEARAAAADGGASAKSPPPPSPRPLAKPQATSQKSGRRGQ